MTALGGSYLYLQNPDALNLSLDFIAGLKKKWRHARKADARGSACADDLSRLKGHAAGKRLYGSRNVEDHIAGIVVLHHLSVHPAGKTQPLRIGQGTLVHDPGAQRTIGVE